ncbi:PRC-barrel domain protein [Methanocaldococcus vulcanius M7]|uniref:PRC-barrel domain protein n=1 Tax=Methanocaldococcus vulcanius (strain ATCC 700851 / DSM 12094 / M7) TaxID=579137 RepID=C9RGT6_METVM|nr:PRC-barrel domain-containing protein [Methanocaldococcus vulcanius]ACX72788.1 PRC-barrel domain protein [Methanocaldococcus vulcanius M7]
MERMPAKLLFERTVIGNKGSVMGKVKDIVFDEKVGRLVSLEIEPSEHSPVMREEGKNVLLPYKLVVAIKDVVVIDESNLNRINIRVADQ